MTTLSLNKQQKKGEKDSAEIIALKYTPMDRSSRYAIMLAKKRGYSYGTLFDEQMKDYYQSDSQNKQHLKNY